MNIEEEIAQKLAEWAAAPNGAEPWQVEMYADAAAALMPLVRRAQAEALREAADAWHEQHHGTRPVPYLFMVDRADRIEQEARA